MNEIKSEQLIENLTLNFFNTINADIRQNNKIFEISVPGNYSQIFGRDTFVITFDSKTASDSIAELVTTGSEILSKIINICKSKGPIVTSSVKNSNKDSNNHGIRFYFNILFQGKDNFSDLTFVDLDIRSSESLEIKDELLQNNEINLENINFDAMSSLYIQATKLIRKKYEKNENEIKNITFKKRENEIEKINDQYGQMISEIEDDFKKIDVNEGLENEKHKLYDKHIEKIQEIRTEKDTMIKTISAKFNLIFTYNLVAVSIFSY